MYMLSTSKTRRSSCDAMPAGVVLLDERFLRAKWPMWELGVMMEALPDQGQLQPGPAARAVVPVLLMDFDAVGTYEEHWTPAATEAARGEGFLPATLADLRRLLVYQGIRQDQVHIAASAPVAVVELVIVSASIVISQAI